MSSIRLALILLPMSCSLTCKVDTIQKKHKTKHVIVIVVDGARYTETFGDSTHANIPFLYQTLLPQASMLTNFRNLGNTWTSAGHDAICTGVYEPLDNSGSAFPSQPSIFQYWRKERGQPAEKSWVISSKDKLFVLSNTASTDFQTKWMPSYDCGLNGPFSGYRDDSITKAIVLQKLNQHHPDLVLVNFREPDYSGHTGVWQNYLAGISTTDRYISDIWSFLQTDPYYAGSTALIVTNDHGRHLDNFLDGFRSHGDGCEGCRHLEFIAAGPDFKKNFISDINYNLIDIPSTIAELLDFKIPTSGGKVMYEIMR